MIKKLVAILLFVSPSLVFSVDNKSLRMSKEILGNQYLPQEFMVYVHDYHASTSPQPGDRYVILPTNNYYLMNPGCYVLCLDPKQGVYETEHGYFVAGQFRIPGMYNKAKCVPNNFITHEKMPEEKLKSVCNELFEACHGQCSIDYETGQWFDE